MESIIAGPGRESLERRVAVVGLVLVAVAIAVTAGSYARNMTFQYQWLVWVITAVFVAVAILAFELPLAWRRTEEAPAGMQRRFLVASIPLAFIVSSQVCGLGLRACSTLCHVTNFSLIALGAVMAIQLYRRRSVVPLLIPMVVLSLAPHCVCNAPINVVWHGMLGGFSPACEMIPLGATLFALASVRGVRPRWNTTLAVAMLVIMVFISVGGALFGFPWGGCVDHSSVEISMW